MKKTVKLAILASGKGSNFQALLQAVKSKEIPNTEIALLFCNNPTAPVVAIAKEAKVPVEIVASPNFKKEKGWDRAAYDKKLLDTLKKLNPDYICLAGYMLLLGKELVRAFPNRIFNIHPSLLPAFKGLNAQKQAFDFGVQWSGCTVHLVNEDLDAGAILTQCPAKILKSDTAETFADRLLQVEHKIYVETIKRVVTRGFSIRGGKVYWGK